MAPVRKVFLSSTARDLGPCREAVFRAISGLDGFQCLRMEDFGARPAAADPFCRERVAECDVFVALVGFLYGSIPPGGTVSFTEGEHEEAKAAGIPCLFFVASDAFPLPPTLREPDGLWQSQQRFRESAREQVVAFFDGPEPLATEVVKALRNLERKEGSAGAPQAPVQDLARVTAAYLAFLGERYRYLDFKGLGVSDRMPLRMPLLEMFVPLNARVETPRGETWERLRVAGRQPTNEETAAIGLRISEPQPILDILTKTDGLVVLGDPGAGKSTFLKFLAVSLANGQGKRLGLEGRLPVLVPLAAYANELAGEEVRLDGFLARYAKQRGVTVDLGPLLEEALRQGKVLFLLDGLDEVRDLALRNTVVERVRDCYSAHRVAGNKLVVTSRIVGYREVRPEAEGFTECTLVDFDDREIKGFVEKWTAAVERAAAGTTAYAAGEAARERRELLEAIHGNPGVRSLAANPLLLTILAVMKRQGVILPERRAELYQTYVEALLRGWNLVRSLAGRPSRDVDLIETLKVIAPLALWMHETSPGVGLVKEWDLHRELARIYREERGSGDPEAATRRFLADVRDHAALLLDRGGRQYGFIHLLFQEYLAAMALAEKGQEAIGPVVEALAARVGDPAWHEVTLLTVGYLGLVQKRDKAASSVVEELVARAPGLPGEAALLAAQAVADAGTAGVTLGCRQAVEGALLATLRADGAKVVQRVAAGSILSRLGDPRLEVLTVDGMEFCQVTAGPFRMGDEPFTEVDLPYGYQIGRYPVTVSQFRQYVEASGSAPEDPDSLREAANAPVRWMRWHEAQRFCAWLSGRWRGTGRIEHGWSVGLPSEAEWEKAARGTDGRRYPWGDEIDIERASYAATRIGGPSAVGCFPGGASPYGCEEMSGNVWEWTRSVYGPYPYPTHEKKCDLWEDSLASGPLVLRGGSFDDSSGLVRCTIRGRRGPSAQFGHGPSSRFRLVGFRVVVLPFSLISEHSGPSDSSGSTRGHLEPAPL